MQKYPVDRLSDKILVISYPAGGFGHFIFYLLTHFTQETVKVPNTLEFSPTGDSHHQHRYMDPWYSNRDANYQYDCSSWRFIGPDETVVIVHDSGHRGEDRAVQEYFPNARFIKVYAELEVRMTLLELSIFKALQKTWQEWLELQMSSVKTKYDVGGLTEWTACQLIWKYANILFPKFCPSGYHNVANVSLKNLILDTERTFIKLATDLNLTVINRDGLHDKIQEWTGIHQKYFKFLYLWQEIEKALDRGANMDLSGITDQITKSMIFYNVCNKYYIKVPVLEWHSDTTPSHIRELAINGFTSTNHILNFVETHDSL